MSNRLIQYGFTAGIVSESLWGQTILQKYGYGLADCRNYIVEFTGMLTSRPGLVASSLTAVGLAQNFRLEPFIFAQEDANTFALLFVPNKLFFLQQGRFQLEAGKTITAASSNGTRTQITCVGHGYSAGDLVELYGDDIPEHLVGQTVHVSGVPDVDTFNVQQIHKAADMDGWTDAAIGAGEAFKVYSIATPYADQDLPNIYTSQARDVVDITSNDFAQRALERQADGTWTLTISTHDTSQVRPTGLAKKAQSSAAAGIATLFAVTAINAKGEESAADYEIISGMVNYTGTAGWVSIEWNATPGAVHYNIYRSIVNVTTEITKAAQVGFLAQSGAPQFVDNNYIPDYTTTPPRIANPFANGAVIRVIVTNAGSGYSVNDTMSFVDSTGSGANAIGELVVNDSGEVIGVLVINSGQDYETPAINITSPGGGSGATFTIETTDASGNYPAVSATHEQRKVYAASFNEPLTVWGSRIGLFRNFTRSQIIKSDDSYEYGIASPVLGRIKHLMSTRTGLLAFSNIGIWSLTGSVGSITATDAEADLQTSVGCSDLKPLYIDADIAYAETSNRTIRLLRYNDFSKNFGGMDISVLARELFDRWYNLNEWSFETRPYKLIWATRNDGLMLACTVSQEQDVFAWHRHDTEGEIEANITLPESEREVTYVVTKRYLAGRWVRVVEYFADRTKSENENHIGVDCAVPFGNTVKPHANLTIDDTVDPVEINSSGAIFTPDDEGKYIKYREGKAFIDNYVSTTKVEVTIINDFDSIKIPYSGKYKTIPQSEWYLTTLLASYRLPLNFRPETVTVFGDGKIFPDTAVGADGTVTFAEDLSFGYIGFNFDCEAITLPFVADGTIIEDSRKDVIGVGIRYKDSKGLEVGTASDDTYPIDTLLHENLAEASRLNSGHEYVVTGSDWDEDTRIYIKANGAVPTQVSGIVVDLEVGDDVD